MTRLSLSPNISPIFLQFPIYISSSHSLQKLKRHRSLLWFSHKARLITVTEYDYSLSHLFPVSLSYLCTVNSPSCNSSSSNALSKHCNELMQLLKAKAMRGICHMFKTSKIHIFYITQAPAWMLVTNSSSGKSLQFWQLFALYVLLWKTARWWLL